MVTLSAAFVNGVPNSAGQRRAWARLRRGWEKWDSVIMDQLGPVSTAMILRLEVAEGRAHLNCICVAPSTTVLLAAAAAPVVEPY